MSARPAPPPAAGRFTLTVSVSGNFGEVWGFPPNAVVPNLQCINSPGGPNPCSEPYAAGTRVTLVPQTFTGTVVWTGCDEDRGNAGCIVNMNARSDRDGEVSSEARSGMDGSNELAAVAAPAAVHRAGRRSSLLLNLALVVPAIYMLEVFDRVFASRSVETLAMLSLLATGALGLGFCMDRARGLLLARAGRIVDEALSPAGAERGADRMRPPRACARPLGDARHRAAARLPRPARRCTRCSMRPGCRCTCW